MTDERPLIYEAMLGVLHSIGPVGKSAKNIESGYAARSIDDVMDALHGPMAEYGVFVLPTLEDITYTVHENRKGTLMTTAQARYRFTFYAIDGSSVSMVIGMEGRDAADKATSKAQSNALKYGLLHAFMIPVKDVDPDTETLEVVRGKDWTVETKKAVYEMAGRDSAKARDVWQTVRAPATVADERTMHLIIDAVEQALRQGDETGLVSDTAEIVPDPPQLEVVADDTPQDEYISAREELELFLHEHPNPTAGQPTKAELFNRIAFITRLVRDAGLDIVAGDWKDPVPHHEDTVASLTGRALTAWEKAKAALEEGR